MKNFWKMLISSENKLKFSATGHHAGHVLTATPIDDSKEAKRIFLELVTILGAGLIGAGLLIFSTLRRASTSQALAVYKAIPVPGSTLIGFLGYCVEATKKSPAQNEKYAIIESKNTNIERVEKFLRISDKTIESFIDEYYFLQKFDIALFKHNFKQAGIWTITDNIGFVNVKKEIFPDHMFFTFGAMEILFYLRDILVKSGENIRNLQFDKELIQIYNLNHELGFIPDDLYRKWQTQFNFHVD